MCVALLLALPGCHWALPLPSVTAEDGAVASDGARPDLDAAHTTDVDEPLTDLPKADGLPDLPIGADGASSLDVAAVDLGCNTPPGTCGTVAEWTVSSGNCGKLACEKSCGLRTVFCSSSPMGGQTTCQCELCGAPAGQPMSYQGNADTAVDAVLSQGYCMPP